MHQKPPSQVLALTISWTWFVFVKDIFNLLLAMSFPESLFFPPKGIVWQEVEGPWEQGFAPCKFFENA